MKFTGGGGSQGDLHLEPPVLRPELAHRPVLFHEGRDGAHPDAVPGPLRQGQAPRRWDNNYFRRFPGNKTGGIFLPRFRIVYVRICQSVDSQGFHNFHKEFHNLCGSDFPLFFPGRRLHKFFAPEVPGVSTIQNAPRLFVKAGARFVSLFSPGQNPGRPGRCRARTARTAAAAPPPGRSGRTRRGCRCAARGWAASR